MKNHILILASLFALGASSHASAQALDNAKLWRVQVRTHTCNVTNAGTDDPVWVSLNDDGTRFFLDRGGDDRERNEWLTYDVVLPHLGTAIGINKIEFGKSGTDGWCFDDVQLIVNSINTNVTSTAALAEPAFTIFDMPNAITWIDDPAPRLVVAHAALRANPLWNLGGSRAQISTLRLSLPGVLVEQVIEGIVGNEMVHPDGQMKKLKWGTRDGRAYVQIVHAAGDPANRARVDLDLAMQKGGITEFRDVDVDFKMDVSCGIDEDDGKPKLTFAMFDVDADAGALLNVLSFGISVAVANRMSRGISLDRAISTPVCPPAISFGSDGTLNFL